MSDDVVNLTIPVPGDLARAYGVESMGVDERIQFVAQYLTDPEESAWGISCCGVFLGDSLPRGAALAHLRFLTRPDHTPKLTRRVVFDYTDWPTPVVEAPRRPDLVADENGIVNWHSGFDHQWRPDGECDWAWCDAKRSEFLGGP